MSVDPQSSTDLGVDNPEDNGVPGSVHVIKPKDLENPNYGRQGDWNEIDRLAHEFGYQGSQDYVFALDKYIAKIAGKNQAGHDLTSLEFFAALDKFLDSFQLYSGYQLLAQALMNPQTDDDKKFGRLLAVYRPRAYETIIYFNALLNQKKFNDPTKKASDQATTDMWEAYMTVFTRDGKNPYKPAFNFLSTDKILSQFIQANLTRPSIAPEPVYPWEMRIGASKFLVPPININVSQTYKVGSITGGALRQQSTPKFNSGYSETVIDMTLYFPNYESIWGLSEVEATNINFDANGDSDQKIDNFLSSLRGLITTFKYAPFLPVRNQYLNQAWGITAVALNSMTINTLENYPFCIAVNLQLLKFNHKVYLPVIEDFNEAVHWGRYRQYMGRAAQKMASTVTQGFLVEDKTLNTGATSPAADASAPDIVMPDKGADIGNSSTSQTVGLKFESDPSNSFDLSQQWTDGKHFDVYYPTKTPARVFAPDNSYFRQPQEDIGYQRPKDSWDLFMGFLGIDLDHTIDAQYDNVQLYSKGVNRNVPEQQKMLAFLGFEGVAAENISTFSGSVAQKMGAKDLDDYINQRVAAAGAEAASHGKQFTSDQQEALKREIRNTWFTFLFTGYRDTPFFQSYLQDAQFRNGHIVINEWEVPMSKMPFDWNKIHINGISVNLGNNLARLQVQLQDEPVHQHIGGRDSRVDISMVIFGEEELIKFQKVFEHIRGLARLEHAHGVLGFLGIKNILTALCGIKYVLPLSYEVDSIPGFPRVYNVRLSFVDFDVFQQQRENLSIGQQKELVEAFGKRNPFLRIKQLWGAFNAYPDFPLSIRDDAGAVVGHLEPDFYFRAFQTIDDQVAHMGHGVSRLDFASFKSNSEAEAAIVQIDKQLTTINDQLATEGVLSIDGRRNLTGQAKSLSDQKIYLKGRISSGDPAQDLLPDFNPTSGSNFTDQIYPTYATSHTVNHMLSTYGEDQDKVAMVEILPNSAVNFSQYDIKAKSVTQHNTELELREESPVWMKKSFMPGVTTDFATHQSPTIDVSDNLTKQFQGMMLDSQYRDISGRMVRAFPTYMLWLIDEGGRFAGVKLFDNFYGLQSVIDFSLLQSEDILGDTLVLRLSNIYQKLTTPYKGYIARQDPNQVVSTSDADRAAQLIDRPFDVWRNLLSGTDPQYIVDIANIQLKPGVRVHLRMGYSANPNALQTVFNGTITQVEAGDIVTITAQSDAIELAPYVNSTNKKGDSGKIDGALNTGLWMSEPRDLMVRLLSMGSSTFKETIAAATEGMIFSENRFGIRHFGQILYEPLNNDEETKQNQRYDVIQSAFNRFTTIKDAGSASGAAANMFDGLPQTGFQALGGATATRTPVIALVQAMWINFMKKRDYELFKRNIYPGNGLGIAQYLGGDAGDGGTQIALTANAQGKANPYAYPDSAAIALANDPVFTDAQKKAELEKQAGTSSPVPSVPLGSDKTTGTAANPDPNQTQGAPMNALGGDPAAGTGLIDIVELGASLVGDLFSGRSDSPILQALGFSSKTDDDIAGFNEICFRAQTYMKSVWDLFQLCAALQPNYIVSVRPFEDRSTVFYGKPHWLWTSAVIPLTTGVPDEAGPKMEGPDAKLQELEKKIMQEANPLSDFESQLSYLKRNEGTGSPFTSTVGTVWAGTDVTSLPDVMSRQGANIRLAAKEGKVSIEMHLPTSSDAATDRAQHKQLVDLKPEWRHATYMDKSAPGQAHGGEAGFTVDPGDRAGNPGAFGYLDPKEEQWYMNMLWNYDGHKEAYKYARVLCYNTRTKIAVVCSIGEAGPAASTGRIAGLSPDAFWITQSAVDDIFQFGFVPDDTPLGPISNFDATAAKDNNNSGVAGANSGNLYVTINEAIFKSHLSKAGQDVLGGAFNDNGSTSGATTLFNDNQSTFDPTPNLTAGGYAEYQITDPTKIAALRIDDTKVDWFNDDFAREVKGHNPTITPIEYAFQFGGWPRKNELPVFLDPYVFSDTATNQDQDTIGIQARELYDATYAKRRGMPEPHTQADGGTPNISVDTAQDIWNELRERAYNIFLFVYVKAHGPGKTAEENVTLSETVLTVEQMQLHAGNIDDIFKFSDSKMRDAYLESVRQFLNFLWQDRIARAFVITSTAHKDDNNITGIHLTHGDDWDFERSPIILAYEHWQLPVDQGGLGGRADIVQAEVKSQDPSKVVKESETHANMLKFMIGINITAGKTGTVSEKIAGIWDETIGKWIQYIATALTGVVGAFRLSMMQLGEGLGMVSNMQRQANILNKVFNDSIYYQAGPVGSLLFLADNPFTREYGEPVIEIREPFQRVHFISSFQHIINNGIQQTTNNVPTVVTATSDGQYPVTVYFDKGMSSDKQVESVIETGLFWDNARGEGFFGFLHPLLHPIETIRSLIKQASGSSDELLSKRVALYHLKEGLKDIYQGEVIVLGNPDIRPHDLIYIADVYERMYGMFEVEQVVHHFTPETGFITSITPNALVTINDPARWSITSWMSSWWSVKSMRDATRLMFFGSQGTNAPVNTSGIGFDDLQAALQPQILGTTQYTHGNSALIRDFASYKGIGLLGEKLTSETIAKYSGTATPDQAQYQKNLLGGLANTAASFAIPGLYFMQDFFGDIWDWFKENLVDQHNCYVQFLTKDGTPMDAGLSYNQGVAVGTHYSTSLLPGLLGLPMQTRQDGHARVTTDDLMKALGWQEQDVSQVSRDVSWWINQTNSKVLDLSGTGPNNDANQLLGFGKVTAEIVTVGEVFDGDTFKGTNGVIYRFDGINTPELVDHSNIGPDINPPSFLATRARDYCRKRLIDDPISEGYAPTVAIRSSGTDATGNRTLATIFHNVPPGTLPQDRDKVLLSYATKTPLVSWDSYLEDGRPYTVNWEMVMMGFSQTILFSVARNDPDRGARGTG